MTYKVISKRGVVLDDPVNLPERYSEFRDSDD